MSPSTISSFVRTILGPTEGSRYETWLIALIKWSRALDIDAHSENFHLALPRLPSLNAWHKYRIHKIMTLVMVETVASRLSNRQLLRLCSLEIFFRTLDTHKLPPASPGTTAQPPSKNLPPPALSSVKIISYRQHWRRSCSFFSSAHDHFTISTTHLQLNTSNSRSSVCIRLCYQLDSITSLPLECQRQPYNTATTSFALRHQTASSCKHRHILNTRPPPAEVRYSNTTVVLSV